MLLRLVLIWHLTTPAFAVEPDPVQTKVLQAMEAWESGDLQAAFSHLSMAVELKPRDAELRYNLGVIALAQQNVTSALTHFETTLKYDPKHLDTLFNLGRLYVELGRHTEGRELLMRARSLAPDDPAYALEVAASFAQEGKREAALSIAREIQPKNAAVFSMLAYLCLADERPIEALEFAESAQREEPMNQRHRLLVAQAHIESQEYAKALEALDIAAKNSEDAVANIPFLRSVIDFAQLRFASAAEYFAKAKRLAPAAFTKGKVSPARMKFPTALQRVAYDVLADADSTMQGPDFYSQLQVGAGCSRAEVIGALYRSADALNECRRGSQAQDIGFHIRKGRAQRLQMLGTSQNKRCVKRVVGRLKLGTNHACYVAVRLGKSLVQP